MKKYIFGDRIGTTIDLYAFIITLLIMGFFLYVFPSYILTESITKAVQMICFSLASVLLMRVGVKLHIEKGILGIKEMAIGTLQLYLFRLMTPVQNGWSIFFFLSIGFYVFNLVGGLLAFLHTTFNEENWGKEGYLAKMESVVAILTSLFSATLAGIQMMNVQ